MRKEKTETYQIKVNRLLSENDKLIPYSKYIKNDYPQLTKVVPKNSILYKAKCKPDIVINEYYQTSKNFNTNIKKKVYPSENNPRINNELSKTYQNSDYINFYDRNYFTEKPIRNTEFISKINLSGNFSSKEDKTEFSPYSNGNGNNLRFNYKKRLYPNKEYNMRYNNKTQKNLSNFLFQSSDQKELFKKELEKHNTSNFNELNINDDILSKDDYLKFSYKGLEKIKKNTQEMIYRNSISSFKNKKYNKRKNLSMGLIDLLQKKEIEESSLDSFRNKMKNNIINKKKFFRNRITIDDTNDIKDRATQKMEIYREKLFKEFYKHFKKFIYRHFVLETYELFINNLKHMKKEKKIYFNANKFKDNYKISHKKKHSCVLLNEDNHEANLMEGFKPLTSKNYYKIYNELKEYQNSNPDFKNIFGPNKFSNKFNKNKNNSQSLTFKNKYGLNASPKNKNYLSLKNKKEKIPKEKSPSIHIGNKTIINRDISFGSSEKKENELFRDSKELSKKFEQIQRRRKKLKLFNRSIELNNNKSMKSIDYNIHSMNDSEDIKKLRRYISEIKKENSLYESLHRKSVENEKIRIEDDNINEEEITNINISVNKRDKDLLNNSQNHNSKPKKMKKNKNANINTNINKKIINNYDKNIIYKINSIDDKYSLSQKNSIYYNKKVKQSNKNKIFSIVIKDISTKDNLIQINIKYYFMKRIKPLKPRYNSLQQEKILSLSFYGDEKKQKKKKLKDKLTSIQEEDASVQNSRIYDETEVTHKKVLEFIEIINDSIIKKYKKNLLYRIKTIELVYKMNNIFNSKENNNDNKDEIENKENKSNIDKKEDIIPNEENKNIKIIKRIIYNKKRGYKINKKSSLENKNKSYNDQINKFRLELIKFSINSIHKK